MSSMSMADYLRLPAWSQGAVAKMLTDCPRAAWWDSYLNPHRPDETSDAADAGSIAHSIVLEGSTRLCKVFNPAEFPNMKGGGVATGWTNKAIQDARDQARADGLIPVLQEDFGKIEFMAGSTRDFIKSLRDTEPAVFEAFDDGFQGAPPRAPGGFSEQVYQWDDDGVPCKIRTDRISVDRRIIVDLKFSALSVEPARWARSTLLNMGYLFASAFYRRGIRRLFSTTPTYLWLNTSTEQPHLSSLCGLDEAGIALGDAQVELALKRVRKCLQAGRWPDYGARVSYTETPAWAVAQFEEQQIAGGVFE